MNFQQDFLYKSLNDVHKLSKQRQDSALSSQRYKYLEQELIRHKLRMPSLLEYFPVTIGSVPRSIPQLDFESVEGLGRPVILGSGGRGQINELDMRTTQNRLIPGIVALKFGLGFLEEEEGSRVNVNIKEHKSFFGKEAIYKEVNRLGFEGDDARGIVGIFNHPEIPRMVVSSLLTASGPSAVASPEAAMALLDSIGNQLKYNSGNYFYPNAIMLPTGAYNYVKDTKMTDATGEFIGESFMRKYQQLGRPIQLFEAEELNSVNGGVDQAIAYYAGSDAPVSLLVHFPFEVMGPWPANPMQKEFYMMMGTLGIQAKYPTAALRVEFPGNHPLN